MTLTVGKMLLHVEEIGDFRAAPAVDALVVIADDAEIAMLAGERMDEIELGGVGVLIFVHHDVTILRAAGFEGVGMFGEQLQREENQVVEIHGVAGVQGGFVLRADVLGQRGDAGIGKRGGVGAAVLVTAQQAREWRRDRSFRLWRRCG